MSKMQRTLPHKPLWAALHNLHRYNGDSSIVGWLIGIAKRKTADFFRSNKDARNALSLDANQLMNTLPTSMQSPEAHTEQTLQLERVAACLQSISPDRAEAVTLKIYGGLSTTEIAHIMNRSEDAVYALVSRGLKDLRERLGDTDHAADTKKEGANQ